ncbi:MAG: hypothetical protein U0289_06610 [Cyclobacteriaceae bacterium]|jgi:hypothetical protein|nr:hypothetical protein [Cytophagales bacterium]
MERLKSIEIKLIAAFLLVTGFLGFVALFSTILSTDNSIVGILYLFIAVLFGLTMYSGYLLLKEDEKGLEIGRAIIALQILNFDIAGLSYLFTTGGAVLFGLGNSKIGFDFVIQTGFTINLNDESTNFILRINLLAIGLFVYLSRTIRKLEDEQEIQEELEKKQSEKVDK